MKKPKTTVAILAGDTIENYRTIEPQDGRFVFIIRGEEIFYMNTGIGQMWKTTKKQMKNVLGEGHQDMIKRFA